MYQIQTTSDNTQEQTFSLYDMNLRLTLYFNNVLKSWQFDLFNIDSNEYITQMKGLSVNSPALIEKSLPFVIVLYDTSKLGINSISKSDLTGRFQLYFMTKEEYYATIRTSIPT